jgi:hypothetical protein
METLFKNQNLVVREPALILLGQSENVFDVMSRAPGSGKADRWSDTVDVVHAAVDRVYRQRRGRRRSRKHRNSRISVFDLAFQDRHKALSHAIEALGVLIFRVRI